MKFFLIFLLLLLHFYFIIYTSVANACEFVSCPFRPYWPMNDPSSFNPLDLFIFSLFFFGSIQMNQAFSEGNNKKKVGEKPIQT